MTLQLTIDEKGFVEDGIVVDAGISFELCR
jgi:hypothetical protein